MKSKSHKNEFEIRFAVMKAGCYRSEFFINDTFFENNVNEDVVGGAIKLNLQIDKQENLIILDFDFEGVLHCACDRCLEKIPMTIAKSEKLILKLVPKVECSDSEGILFLNERTTSYNIEPLVFEYLCMEVPMRKVHEDERLCNQQMLNLIESYAPQPESKEKEIDERWEALKNISITKD